MLSFRVHLSGFVLFLLFFFVNALLVGTEVFGVGGSLCRLCAGFPSRHGSVLGWCAYDKLGIFGSLFRARECTTIRALYVGDSVGGRMSLG